jgi:hypothetical protein
MQEQTWWHKEFTPLTREERRRRAEAHGPGVLPDNEMGDRGFEEMAVLSQPTRHPKHRDGYNPGFTCLT